MIRPQRKRYGTTLTEDVFKAAFELTAEDVEKLRNDVTKAGKNAFGGVQNYVNSRISTTEKNGRLNKTFFGGKYLPAPPL